MRKKIATILMITVLILTSGTIEMFAENEGSDKDGNIGNLTTEQPAETTEADSAESEESSGDADIEAVPEETEEAGEIIDKSDMDTEGAGEIIEEPDMEAKARQESIADETSQVDRSVTLNLGNVTAVSINLSWALKGDLSEGEYCTYKVYDGETEVYSGSDTACKLTVKANSTHRYTVKAIVSSGEGDQQTSTTYTSDAVSVTTPLDSINGLKKLSSYKKVYLSWNKYSGAASYKLEYTGKGANNASLYAGNKTSCVHTVTGVDAVYDVINLYNTKSGAKYSGDLSGKDRFTYTVTALDSNGKRIATGSIGGDVVKTLYYKITFKKAATLTSHSGGKVKSKFAKGQVIYAKGFTEGKYIFDYKCKDGKVRTYYAMKIRVKATLSKHLAVDKKAKKNKKLRGISAITYTSEEAEKYINDRGIKSSTNYMIWGNLYTQKEYIFYSKTKGKKKDWKLVTAKIGKKNRLMSALQVSSGKATMPTATGSTKIVRKMKSCNGTPLWNVTKYFSVHGIQRNWLTPGYPESGACLRNKNDNATWIYNNIPVYSRVFVH